ncbi:hypothetical protein WR25_00621 [Diploscapter pachys]|uniref:Uncharacterized protein n=1 Tax=Diploscapter pachys TaxID=2018661 RepID=A0A2A2LLM1_9BILA|nr:hypothetical protein WR25_00621 [Diploscapter pachys]
MNISTGADMTCGGMCARVSTTINGNPAMSFHCVPTPICRSLGLYNSGGALYLDREIQGYCCNNAPFCNTAGTNINTTGLQPVGAERPKACYSGMCSFYSRKDACIDPTVTPPKLPDFFSDLCWVGVYDKDHNISAGAETFCYDGQCASLTSNIAGSTVNVFACVPNYVCSYLGLYDSCSSVYYDRVFTACCCKSGALCNIAGYDIPIPPQPPRIRDFPITCPSGLLRFDDHQRDCQWHSPLGNALHLRSLPSLPSTQRPQHVCLTRTRPHCLLL